MILGLYSYTYTSYYNIYAYEYYNTLWKFSIVRVPLGPRSEVTSFFRRFFRILKVRLVRGEGTRKKSTQEDF